MRKRSRSVLLLALALAIVALAMAQQSERLSLRFRKISVPNSQATFISGINNQDAMVGYYIAHDGTEHGLLLADEKVTNIDHPNGVNGTYCSNLNSDGTIVGNYYDSSNTAHGFEYQGGNFTDVGPAGFPSIAAGINDKGEFVGGYTSSGIIHGYLWNGKKYLTLDVPGASQTFAADINSHGQIVLDWVDSSGNNEGALYHRMKYTTLDVPGAVQSIPNDLDNAGDVVFSWADSNGNFHGALLLGKNFSMFDDPKAQGATYGSGINDHEVIVGSYFDGSTTWGFKARY